MKEYLKTGLPILAVFVLFMGRLVYEKMNEPTVEEEYARPKTTTSTLSTVQDDIDNYKRNSYGDPVTTKCDDCGGVGRVGYSGKSEERIRHNNGRGLGNYCIVCKGTGKIKKYPNEN